jgi:hypothetical protein
MVEKYLTAKELYDTLLADGIINSTGVIKFKLANTETIIRSRDTIGNSIQSWLGQWLKDNDIFYFEPENTQEFPDFYLSLDDAKDNMMELKTFNNEASPAFDIANFESYCFSLRTKPYRLYADYLIIAYELNQEDGIITIKQMWLKKIWQITGKSTKFALNTQVKRGMIYNIRPKNWYSGNSYCFETIEQFVTAIYQTLKEYKSKSFADQWKKEVQESYFEYYKKNLDIS